MLVRYTREFREIISDVGEELFVTVGYCGITRIQVGNNHFIVKVHDGNMMNRQNV